MAGGAGRVCVCVCVRARLGLEDVVFVHAKLQEEI